MGHRRMNKALEIGVRMPMTPETVEWLEQHSPDLAELVKEYRDDIY